MVLHWLDLSLEGAPWRALFGALAVLVFFAGGCPQRSKLASMPPLELAASPDPRAEADFRSASDARAAGRTDDAYQRFRAFGDVWPKDPLVPFAHFELGRLELARGRNTEARRWFDDVAKAEDPALAERGRMYGAVAAERLGEHQHALSVLRPIVGRTVDPEETSLLLDTIGAAEEALGDDLSALETRDRQVRGELADAKRLEVEGKIRGLVQGLDANLELPRAYEILERDGYAWPEVARRLLRVSHERGDRERVSALAKDLRDQGIELDDELAALVLRAERPSDADPGVIGAILPLSGRGREVGEAALHGLLLASTPPDGQPERARLVYRDDAGDAEQAKAAFEDLVTVHRVIAVIGPMSAGPAQAVAARARELGVPLIALNPDPSLSAEPGGVYRLLPDPREEAGALVQRAVREGARRFGILHPDSGFGQAMRAAFQSAIEKQGASLEPPVIYPPTTTNFVREAGALAELEVDAVILADGASRVALIAPALAAQGLWSVARVGERPPGARGALYLVPALGFDPSLAKSTRRYLQGALFAVPFDAGAAPDFSNAYRDKFQVEPNLFAAAAHDAYRIVEAALATGAATRADVARALGTARATHVATANDGFSPARGPRVPVRIETMLDAAFVRAD